MYFFQILKAVLHAHGEGSDGASGNLVGYAAEVHEVPPVIHISDERMDATVGKKIILLFPTYIVHQFETVGFFL